MKHFVRIWIHKLKTIKLFWVDMTKIPRTHLDDSCDCGGYHLPQERTQTPLSSVCAQPLHIFFSFVFNEFFAEKWGGIPRNIGYKISAYDTLGVMGGTF